MDIQPSSGGHPQRLLLSQMEPRLTTISTTRAKVGWGVAQRTNAYEDPSSFPSRKERQGRRQGGGEEKGRRRKFNQEKSTEVEKRETG